MEYFNNGTYPNISMPVSLSYIKTCDIFIWLSFVVSTVVFFILIFVVLKKSPKEMRIYKWYIVWNTVTIYIFDVFVQAFIHPTAILPTPTPTLVTNGILHLFNMPEISEQIEEYSAHIVISIFIIWYYTLALMFLYRYVQTIRLTGFLKRFLEKWWSSFIHAVILSLIIALILCTINFKPSGFSNCIENFEMYHNMSDKNCLTIWKETKDVARLLGNMSNVRISPIGDLNISFYASILYFFGTFICGSLILYTTYKIYQTFKKCQKNFTKHTYTIYRNFTNALIVEVANSFAFLVIPVSVLILCHTFFQSYIVILSAPMLGIAGLFPLISQCFMLIYIKPYRKALKDFFKSCVNWRRKQSVGPTTTPLAHLSTKSVP